jgi:benzylsuccinate CoA-transferase BbsF subunit
VPWLAFRDKEIVPPSTLNRSPNACPHNVFRAKGDDSWVAIACESSNQWDALNRIVPRLSSDLNLPDFHLSELKLREVEIESILSQWTSQHESWELAEILQEAGIPSAPVVNLQESAELSPLKNHYRVIQQPDASNYRLLVDAEPIRLNGQSAEITRAPMFGEHTHDVFREILGFSDQEIAELVLQGIVS